MHDALKPLVEARWLEEAATSPAEVPGLWTLVDRNLDEARGTLKYSDTRFWLAYYDDCRRKRNMTEYDVAGGVSDREATELLDEAERLAGAVRDWIRREHPELR